MIFWLFRIIFLVGLLDSLAESCPEHIEETGLTKAVSTNPDDVDFYLHYNPKSPNERIQLDFFNISRHYKKGRETKFLIHGFRQNGKSSFPQNVKNSYLRHTETKYNIIIVDWGKLSAATSVLPPYGIASLNVAVVGEKVAAFIEFLMEKGYITASKVHIIGFSLGAHVAGVAGRKVRQLKKTNIARISGLDPAGPGFKVPFLSAEKLNSKDAEFVDVIHTNGVPIIGLGYAYSLGHVDFYPNNGKYQPTCDGPLRGVCSHSKAPIYYSMSIDPAHRDVIKGCQCSTLQWYTGNCYKSCSDISPLGERVNQSSRGDFYLDIVPLPESAFGTDDDYEEFH